jgi:uncharacterized protein (DUF885 family)
MFNRKFKRAASKIVVMVGAFSLLFTTACSSHMFDVKNTVGTVKDDESEYTDVQKKFQDFLWDTYVEEVTADTLTYNYEIKDGEAMGIQEPEITLGDADMSDEGIAKEKAEFDETFNELKSFDREDLTENQQLTYDILYEYMENEELGYLNIYLYEPFSPMKGLQANIATYFTDYRFDDAGDVDRYVQILGMVRDYFDSYLDFEKTKSEKGYFMSDSVCDEVIEQCEDFLDYDDEHFMVTVFNDNIEALDFLTEEEITTYEAANEKAVEESLLPAFQDVIDVLTSLKGTGTNDGGLCEYEGGQDYYTYLLRNAAGTSKTPEEVAEMLDENLSELMSDMYSIAMMDYSSYEYFVDNYDDLFADTDSMAATDIVRALMKTATENYPDIEDISFKAEPLDSSLENIMDNTLAYYMSPAYDDQENNLIRVNGLHTDGLWTTLAHEGYPGHMLQNAYFMSTEPDPIRTVMGFLGYKEGWAMYACYDAINYYDFDGADTPQNVAKLYQINDELNYLVCGRLDIGINYEGWTLEETREYLNENGFNGDAAEEMYTTLVGDPAVYQSYSSGYYELKEIRDYAEEQLGTAFDAKEFNTVVLETGPCQFDILKEQVQKYIDNCKEQ